MVYNGKPYCLMDDLGEKPTIFGNTYFTSSSWLPFPAPSIAGSGSGSVKDLSGKERRATGEFQKSGGLYVLPKKKLT